MITNNINFGDAFTMRINFNLIKKGGENDKKQIWLTTTIDGNRVRVYTGLRIEERYWEKPPRGQVGGRAYEDGSLPRPQKMENVRINTELKKILHYCHEYADAVCATDLMSTPLEHSKDNFEKCMVSKIRGQEASIRMSAEEFIKDYINRKAFMVNKHTRRTLSKGTVYNHKNALQRLQKFCKEKRKKIVWELFNRRFEESFIGWMNEKVLSKYGCRMLN